MKSKELELTVDFTIQYNEKGRIALSVAKKVANYLMANKNLKKGYTYFITDNTGKTTCWSVYEGQFYTWCVSCEFCEDEIAEGTPDWFNGLYFEKIKGKVGEYEYESYKVC